MTEERLVKERDDLLEALGDALDIISLGEFPIGTHMAKLSRLEMVHTLATAAKHGETA